MVKADGETRAHYVPRGADITVLEPADDPRKDPVGTLRQEPPGVSLWQCIHRPAYGTLWLCVHSTAKGNLEAVLDHVDVVGMPVIGVVPGTPAAEAQTPLMPWEPGPRPTRLPKLEDDAPSFKVGDWVRNKQTRNLLKVTEPVSNWLPEYYELAQPNLVEQDPDRPPGNYRIVPNPPLSEYSQHLRHTLGPVKGCDLCHADEVQP